MKIINKILIIFMFVFMSGLEVLADENDSTIIKHRYNNIYGIYDGVDRVHIFYAQRYSLNGDTAYCIEPAVAIDTDVYSSTTNYDITGLSDDDIKYVRLVAYYGYDYFGHDTINYYLAAQELIWDKVTGRKTYWVTDMDVNAPRINISKEKTEIENLVSNHMILPFFGDKFIEINVGEAKKVTDMNRVLADYDIYSTKGVSTKIDGNDLQITADLFKGEGEINLVRKSYLNKVSLIYYNGDNQKLISAGKLDPLMLRVNVKITAGSICLRKLDSETGILAQGDATLKGAKYGIYNVYNELIYTYVIGFDNKVSNLPYGTYTIKELEPSNGYELNKDIYIIVIDNNNQDVYLDVYENVLKKKVNFFKVYGVDKTTILTGESNVQFDIYLKSTNKLVETVVTDNDGYASVFLVYGTYVVKQVTTSKGYEKVEDFEIVIDQSDSKIINKLVSNAKIQAKLKVVKVDKDTGGRIKVNDIKFKIKDLSTNEYICQKVTYPKVEMICEYSTNEDGEFITPYALMSGKYLLEEVDQYINGYLWNNKSVEFEISENSKFIIDDEFGVVFEVNFENKQVLGSIVITKYGEEFDILNGTYIYNKIPLSGVLLGVYAKEDVIDNMGNVIYKKDTLIKKLTTDEFGKAKLDYLFLGKYYIKELMTLDGYILDDSVYEFELMYKDQYTEMVEVFLEIDNYLKKGKLEFIKVDSNTFISLPNTKIEIYTDDNKLIFSGYTDLKGKIVVDDLKVGRYYILEKEAIVGYKLNKEKMYFEILNDKELVKVMMVNDKIKIEVPNTGIYVYYVVEIVSFIFVITGLGIFISENKKR